MSYLAYAEPAPIIRRDSPRLLAFGDFGQMADQVVIRTIQGLTQSYDNPTGGLILDGIEEESAIPDISSLNRVPPTRTYVIRTKYRYAGVGKPRPYPLDDQE